MNLLLKQHYKTVSTEMTELSVQTRLNDNNKKLQEKHLGNIEEISSKRIKALWKEKEGYQNDQATKQLEVDNLQDKLDSLDNAGFNLIDKTPREGLSGMIAFIHPKSTKGVLYELVDRDGAKR